MSHGIIVPQGGETLPEGATVRIVFEPEARAKLDAQPGDNAHLVQFPLVHSKHPGSVNLTNQRIQEILDDDDFSAGH